MAKSTTSSWAWQAKLAAASLAVIWTTVYIRADCGWPKGGCFRMSGFAGRTLWEWLELLVVPVIVALVVHHMGERQSKAEALRAEERQEAERLRADALRNIEEQRSKDEILKSYLDAVGGLLAVPISNDPEKKVYIEGLLRGYTRTVLDRLDGARKGSVIRFLSESGLLDSDPESAIHVSVSLVGANLAGADLPQFLLTELDLTAASLEGAHMTGVNLSGSKLTRAELRNARLILANMVRTNLLLAKIQQAWLFGANMEGAVLEGAQLHDADLSEVNLASANLRNAILQGTNLTNVNFEDADLTGAYLGGADLSGAMNLTQAQLDSTIHYRRVLNLPAHLTPAPGDPPRP